LYGTVAFKLIDSWLEEQFRLQAAYIYILITTVIVTICCSVSLIHTETVTWIMTFPSTAPLIRELPVLIVLLLEVALAVDGMAVSQSRNTDATDGCNCGCNSGIPGVPGIPSIPGQKGEADYLL
jgi:hypothetical protein